MSHRVNLNGILPVEVLTAIIVDRIVDDRSFTCSSSHAKHNYLADVALSISHVCRLWRTIALGSGGKRLWTHAPSRHKTACVEAFMQRSHPLPVFLRIEAVMPRGEKPTSSSLPALQTALQHSARIRTMIVDFDIGNDDFDEEVFNYWVTEKYLKMTELLNRHSFPALEYMSWTTFIIGDYHTFSPNLFNMEVPVSLRRLFLHNAVFSSPISMLCAPLTSLVLERCGSWSDIDDFIATLLNMPSLETLVIMTEGLYNALDTSEHSTQYQRNSIELPRLARLALYDAFENVPLLFTYIRAPITCRIDLTMVFHDMNSETDQYWELWNTLQLAIRAHYQESSPFNRVAVSGAGDDDDRFHICASSPTLPTLNINFYSPYQEYNRQDMRLLRTISALLSLPSLSQASTAIVQNIKLFSAELHDRVNNDQPGFTPPSLVTVQNMIVTGSAVDGFVHALIRNPDRPLLPALQSIGFRQALFCRNDPHIIEPMFAALVGAIVAREHLDSVQSVKIVDFGHCGMTRKAVDLLVEATSAEVLWDERCLSPGQIAVVKFRSDPEREGILWGIIEEAQLPYY